MAVSIGYIITVSPISYGNPEIMEKGSIRAQSPARIASMRRITTHAAQSTKRSAGRCRIFASGLYTSWPADVCPTSGRAGPSAEHPARHEREQEYVHPEEEPGRNDALGSPPKREDRRHKDKNDREEEGYHKEKSQSDFSSVHEQFTSTTGNHFRWKTNKLFPGLKG